MRKRTMITAGLMCLAVHSIAVTHDVMIMDFAFSPANITIQPGDTVRWSNHDFVPHTATALNGLFNSGTIFSGGTWSFTFTTAGLANYRCNIHPHMTGSVNVASTSATVSGNITLEAYIPGASGQHIMFEVRDGASVVDTQMVMLGAGGAYSFATSQIGTRAIAAKGDHWLSKSSGNVTLAAGGTTSVSLTLLNGDSDDDNEVGIGDYAVISSAYNSGPGDAQWDARGDLNGDDAVDIADYAILSQNYGLMGD
ncbi:MAG: hypothetical protein K1X67_05425 [Fimbriimonadaceae bacterium]|nr:hypothetical protein [Fimbriimonadaceae bacterium]